MVLMTIKPFSENISTGKLDSFDWGDPPETIEAPITPKPAFEYKGPIKKPDEITINDLKKGNTPEAKVNIYLQMVGANPKHRRGLWVTNQKNRFWDAKKLLQHHGIKTDAYNTDLLNFLKKQDNRWLLFEKNRLAGISGNSVIKGLMKELGITAWDANIILSRLTDPKAAKKLSRKEKEVLKKYHAGDVIRAAGRKPIEGFGEFYHRDVGWYS